MTQHDWDAGSGVVFPGAVKISYVKCYRNDPLPTLDERVKTVITSCTGRKHTNAAQRFIGLAYRKAKRQTSLEWANTYVREWGLLLMQKERGFLSVTPL